MTEPSADERPERAPADPRPPTPLSRRFVRYLVGFGVGVALGLAPFLGTGFAPLVDLLPLTLHDRVAALAPIVMGVVAVVVQFGAATRISQHRLRRRFAITLAVLAGGFVLLVVLQALLVQEVDILGGERTARFAVGLERPATCDCPPRLSHRECIAQLSLDPARVETCWGTGPTRLSELALTLGYLLVIGGFGGLIGLLLLQEEARRRRP
jgi:hypothetical protein